MLRTSLSRFIVRTSAFQSTRRCLSDIPEYRDPVVFKTPLNTPNKGVDAGSLKAQLLDKSLEFIPSSGFTRTAIERASVSLGYIETTAGIAGSDIDLIHHYVERSIRRLAAEVSANPEFQTFGMTAKVRFLVQKRLEYLEPFIQHWPSALVVMAQPPNTIKSITLLHDLVDEIWHLAGDKSNDFNWYTKRFLLSGVYTSTELYMTMDKSPGFQGTREFLNARLGDTATVGKGIQSVKLGVGMGLSTLQGILRSRGF